MAKIDSVELLRRQYFQCLDPESLALPKAEHLILPETQSRIYSSMFEEKCLKFLPPVRYRFQVLKRIVGTLERAIADPDEDQASDHICECLALYMTQPMPSASEAAQQKSYVTYTAPYPDSNSPTVVLMESRSLLASAGITGFRTWEAALHLASFLCSPDSRHLVTNKNVLELGAGTGFLSIFCAAHLSAKFVLATDGSIDIVNNVKVNLDLNGLGMSEIVNTHVLQWGRALTSGPAGCSEERKAFDLILGADVTYDINSITALVTTMKNLFGLYPKAKILISATVRNQETLDAFLKACEASSLNTKALAPVQKESEQIGFFHLTSTPISVYEITI